MDGNMTENTKTADYLFDGKLMIDTLYDDLITSTMHIARVKQKIQRATTNFKIVEIIDEIFIRQKLQVALESLDNVLKKDDIIAKILKKKSDVFILDKEKTFRCYNLALLTATKSGEQMGLIYSERALLFHSINEQKSCLEDILMAIKCNISPCLKEMLSRIADRMLKSVMTPLYLQGLPESLDFTTISFKNIYCDIIMFNTYGTPNPKIPATGNYIEVKYNNEKGRHLISNRNLMPGTTIIVEDPYVSVLNESLNWDIEHCGRCYKKSFGLIPCPNCIFVMYCDEKCCNEDYENGHRYECPCFSFLHGLNIIKNLRLSFKAICKVGPIELYKLFIGSNNNNNDNGLNISMNIGDIKGFNPKTGMYDSNSYFQICNLTGYNSKHDLPELACASMILAHVLNLKSNFFNSIEEKYKKQFIVFIGSHILQHGISFPINSFGLNEHIGCKIWKSSNLNNNNDTESIVTTIYPFISLISHSCCPNSVCHTLTNGKMCVITNMEIKANEEITISYGVWYWIQDLNYRRDMLWKYYHFKCFCPACSCKWPIFKKITDKIEYYCPICSYDLNYNELVQSKKSILNEKTGNIKGYGICSKCNNEISIMNIIKETQQYYKIFEKACCLINSENDIFEPILLLSQCILYFQLHISPPSKAFIEATQQLEKIQQLLIQEFIHQ